MLRVSLFLTLVLFFSVPLIHGQSATLPPGPMESKVKTTCMECHDASIIVQQRLGKAAWAKEVDKMMKWGALVDPGDRDAFIEYLSTNFPADKGPYIAPRTPAQSKKKAAGQTAAGSGR